MRAKSLSTIRNPGNLAFLRDVFVAATEASAAAIYEAPKLLSGHTIDPEKNPVLVLPGFIFNDLTTMHLRRQIARAGFPVYGTGRLINPGAQESFVKKLEEKLFNIHKKHDGRPVSLIGHSVGGIQAFLLACRHPDKTHSKIFSMGTPYGPTMGRGGSHKYIHGLFNMLNNPNSEIFEEISDYLKNAQTLPEIHAFSSHWDGVIAQEAAENPFSHIKGQDHVMETQTHIGMGWSLEMSRAVVHALRVDHENKIFADSLRAPRISDELAQN